MESKPLNLITHHTLFAAARSGDLPPLKKLLETLSKDGPQPSDLLAAQNDAGETVLYIASDNNFEDVFSYLLGFSDLDAAKIRSKSDLDAFHVAAKKGHLGIVKEMLRKYPELCRVCDVSNTSPLYSAAVHDHLEVVKAILDADPTSLRIVRKNGKTALHNAARYGLVRVVKALIEQDPGIVCIKDKKGQTALHMAVKGTGASIVDEILYADRSILNERDKKGNTALHMATRKSRSQIVGLLVNYDSMEVNAVNSQNDTALDLAEKLQYGDSKREIEEALTDAGGKLARHLVQEDEGMELKRTVSDIKHEVHTQLLQNEKTNRRVTGIAKDLRKLHREAVQNTTNSITVVAVLFASIGFLAIFNLPGQYVRIGSQIGVSNISRDVGFRVFYFLNAASLFISLAVVVVQITLVAWETKAQKQVVSVVNKLMWIACTCTCGAFLSIAFVVVGKGSSWMGVTVTLMGVPILIVTLASMCYFAFRQHCGAYQDSKRRIRRSSKRKSMSLSFLSANISDADLESDAEKKMYIL